MSECPNCERVRLRVAALPFELARVRRFHDEMARDLAQARGRIQAAEARCAAMETAGEVVWAIASQAVGYVDAADRRQDDSSYLYARMTRICERLKPDEPYGMAARAKATAPTGGDT